jgi:polysaccharide pyruvyl transferase WcaK-like protein
MQRTPTKIALLHHTGGGNLGDQASVDAVIGNIRRRWPGSVIALLSMNPGETARIHGVPSYPLRTHTWELGYTSAAQKSNRASKFYFMRWLQTTRTPVLRLPRAILRELAFLMAAFRRIRHFDLLIVSGGGQLTGKSGPWGFPYSILLWFLMAKFAGTRCVFLNVGAGPLTDALTKFFVNRTLYAADYVSFRDEPSQALARNIGFAGDSQVFPDIVYSLEMCTPGAVGSLKRERPIVGISPLAYPNRPMFSTAEQKTTYTNVLAKFALFASLLERRSYSITLFGTDFGEDHATIEDLRMALRDRHNVATPPCDLVEDVTQLLYRISEMDYVVTCRFHAVVFAHLLNKPVLAISPHPKVADLMSALGLSKYCVDIQKFDPNLLADTFEALVRERVDIKDRMAASLATYKSLLKRQLDDLFPANMNYVRSNGGDRRAAGRMGLLGGPSSVLAGMAENTSARKEK